MFGWKISLVVPARWKNVLRERVDMTEDEKLIDFMLHQGAFCCEMD